MGDHVDDHGEHESYKRVEKKGGFESPLSEKRPSGGGGGPRERGEARGGIYKGRENTVVFVCSLVRKPLPIRREANSHDSNSEAIDEDLWKSRKSDERDMKALFKLCSNSISVNQNIGP